MLVPAELWSQAAALDWQPWLAYWERRIRFLRTLEQRFDLDSFTLEPQEAGARWDDDRYQLALTPEKLVVRGHGVGVDRSVLLDAMALAIEALRPFRIDRVEVSLQYLDPTVQDSEQPQADTTSALFASWAPTLELTDYAVILDGLIQNTKYQSHLEIGILSRSEIPQRLAGLAGDVRTGTRASYRMWAAVDLPEVAFYLGSTWTWSTSDEDDPSITQIADFWDTASEQAEICLNSFPSAAKARDRPDEEGTA